MYMLLILPSPLIVKSLVPSYNFSHSISISCLTSHLLNTFEGLYLYSQLLYVIYKYRLNNMSMTSHHFVNFPDRLIQQWAALYQPLTFHANPHPDKCSDSVLNKLDPAKAFRGKPKPPTPKKKQPAQVSASKGQAVSGRHSVIKR